MIRVTVTTRGVPRLSADPVEMELPPGSTVATALDLVLAKGGPKQDTDRRIFRDVIATVNGRYVPASWVEEWVLVAGDQLTVIPLVVGG